MPHKRMILKTIKTSIPFKPDNIEFLVLLIKFLNPFDFYTQHNQSNHLLDGTTYHSKSHLETNFFQPVREKFIHCIITNDNMSSWVLITELDVFISNRKDLDNCGYRVPAEKQQCSASKLQRKRTIAKNMRSSSNNMGIIKLLQLEAYTKTKISFVVVSWGRLSKSHRT